MTNWFKWDETKPEAGDKVIIVCSDHCSSAPALVGDDIMPLHAEDGYDLGRDFVAGSIWTKLPEDWPLAFMELSEADWF